jgi:hypothetical protein
MPELNALDDLIRDLDYEPTNDQIDELYEIFEKHFIQDGVIVEGRRLEIYRTQSKLPIVWGLPECFAHVVTREGGVGRRYFDPTRANKIHWLKPILIHSADDRIHVFNRTHDKTGALQYYFWFKEKEFVVILRNFHKDHFLVTAYCVDSRTEKQFTNWYQTGKCNKKPHIVCGARNLGHCD